VTDSGDKRQDPGDPGPSLQLSQESELYRDLVETIPDAVIILQDSGYRYVNPAFTELFGYSPEEATNTLAFTDLVLAEDLDAVKAQYQARLSGDEPPRTFRLWLQSKSGERIYCETSARLTQHDGRPADLVVIRNITERWRAEQALRESEEKYRSVVERSNDGIVLAQDELIVLANPRSAEMMGYPLEELAGRSIQSLMRPDTVPMQMAAYQRFMAGEEDQQQFEIVLPHRDGHLLNVELTVGEATVEGRRAALVFMRDITERKRTEEALRRSELRLRQVIDLVPHFIFAKDRAGRFILVNRALAEAYGTTPRELVGKTDADFNDNADEVEQFRRDDNEVMDRGQLMDVPREVITDAAGQQRILHTIKIPFTLSGSDKDAVLGVALDTTEQARAEEERQQLEQQVWQAQKLESLGVLAGGIAHDFNNLLVGILGNAELALMDTSEGPTKRCLDEILAAAERASALTQQMLAYSGKGQFVVEQLDLSEELEGMLELVGASLPKRVALRRYLRRNLPRVEVDRAQLQQVALNLLSNAAEAIADRSGVISLSTGHGAYSQAELATLVTDQELAAGTYVYLEVADSGCGIEPPALEKIFDPFYTTKFTGRGLGLSAVLGIIRGHGGALSVESEPDQGTIVRALFPAAGPVADKDEEAAQVVPAVASGILVVDDEAIVLSFARRGLERIGYKVLLASDGRQAVEIFKERSKEIALVLLDLAMPGIGGEEVFVELRRIDPQVQVLLCSGFSEKEATRRFGEHGLAGFIQKPFKLKALQACIEGVLAARIV
jgi:two-component system cell cycle sensor histidine kinase/response regulator CckA